MASIRIMADDAAEADAVQEAIAASGLHLAGGDRDYPNRRGFGIRRYLDVRVPETRPIQVRAARADRGEIEGPN